MANILVIGAGIAGLAAANELQSSGFKVTVLEGRNRIGGRIYTDRTLGLPVDLGASWIHGITKNPIAKLAQDSQFRLNLTDYDNMLLYGTNGQPIREKELDECYSLYEYIIDQVQSMAEDLEQDISIGEGVQSILELEELAPQQKKLLKWWIASEIMVETGADLDNLSLWCWDEDEEFDGDDYMFPDGYDQIIQQFAKGIDIQLQQKVIEVEYGDRGVSVKTDRGSFAADAAVITLPVGVLKSKACTFTPPLPKDKQAAIARLTMGVLNKVVLKFPKIFWPDDYDMFGYITPKEKDFSEFFNLHRATREPVLIALAGGSFARSLEGLSEEEVGERAMKLLRRVYGNSIPNPEAVVMTRWATDPFSLGSYSYIPVGATMGDRSILAKTVGDRLFFAGEATSRDYPATVHGAFLSGLREAKHIAKEFQP